MRLKVLALSVLVLVVGLAGCRGKVTKKAVKKGEVLKSSIESFEKNRSKFASKVTASIENANQALAEENPNPEEISRDFEAEWKDIQKRYNKMKKDFEDVGSSSTTFFNQLNDLAEGINNEDIKQSEIDKNAELLKKWEVHYTEAASSIENVQQVLEDGNDFHRVLVLSSVRQKLESNVEELQKISEKATELLKDLEDFTNAGRELVEG
jgi:hypothetical protein